MKDAQVTVRQEALEDGQLVALEGVQLDLVVQLDHVDAQRLGVLVRHVDEHDFGGQDGKVLFEAVEELVRVVLKPREE